MYEGNRRNSLCAGVLLLSLLAFSVGAEARTYCVTWDGCGDKMGGGWGNALDEGGFRNKLKASEAGDVFWVAKGVYRPSAEKDRNASFILKEGVKLYGGFKGDETVLEARSPEVNVTVLTGDLDGDDERDGNGATSKAENIVGENSYTVVRSSGCTAAAVLDGFTVCGGIGEEGKVKNYAGGMHNVKSSPTITRCVFSGNKAVRYMGSGGGMCNDNGSNPVISHCTFSGNASLPASCAGGMCNSYSSPTVTHCTFSGNSGYAGGMLNDGGNPVIAHCVFSGNEAGSGRAHGGGMHNASGKPVIFHCSFSGNRTAIAFSSGGGMYNAEKSEAVVTYCTFSKNEAIKGYGGGMYNKGASRPTIAYCTFSENDAGDGSGGGMYNDDRSTPTVSCCVFSGNKANGANGKGGGMFNQNRSEPTVVNCTFSGNAVEEGKAPWGGFGGGMYNKESSKPIIVNCTFFGNRVSGSGSSGGGMYNGNKSSLLVINCIFWNNGTEIASESLVDMALKNCVIQGWREGGVSVISADPQLGVLQDNGGPTFTHALPSGSVALDVGTLEGLSLTVRELLSVDQRGYRRTDGKPDIGAYEFMQQPVPVPTKFAVRVSWNEGGSVKYKGAAVTSPFKTEVASGDSLAFDITANTSFVIGTLSDNGTDDKDAAGKSGYRYALDNVTAAHTLSVSFKALASNPPASSDPLPNEPQKPNPEKPAPSPSPAPDPKNPLPPESSDVPPAAMLPDIPISPERWNVEVVPEPGNSGMLRFTLTTSIETQQPIAFLDSKMRGIVEGTLRTELAPEGRKAGHALTASGGYAALGGSPRRYDLKLTGNVSEGNLPNTAVTAIRYRLEGDSRIRSVPLPESGIPVSRMHRAQTPPQKKSGGGGCETGLGSLALFAFMAFGIRRGR